MSVTLFQRLWSLTDAWFQPRERTDDLAKPEPDAIVVERYARTLQKDGRLLLRHLARRSDDVMPQLASAGGTGAEPCVDVLFKPAEEIFRDPAQMAVLIHTVDQLSLRAKPANVRSIRITSAFLKMSVEDGEPPPFIASEARRISFYMILLTAFAFVAFVTSIALLADADYGRRLLQQVEKLRASEHENELALNSLTSADFRAGSFTAPSAPPAAGSPPAATAGKYEGPRCDERKEGEWQQPVTAMAMSLCRQKDDIRNRLGLAYVGLADWNCWNHDFNWIRIRTPRSELDCGAPMGEKRIPASSAPGSTAGPTPDGGQAAALQLWRSHETRVSASIAVMTGFLLPMLLGFLGGCAYVFRRFDDKLLSWSLEPHDGKHAVVRVLIAAMLGGLVAVLWTSDEPVKVGGFSLSLAAMAFFVGFSVEAVFTLIQTLISGVISSVRTPRVEPASSWPGQGAAQIMARNNPSSLPGSGREAAVDKPLPGSAGAASATPA